MSCVSWSKTPGQRCLTFNILVVKNGMYDPKAQVNAVEEEGKPRIDVQLTCKRQSKTMSDSLLQFTISSVPAKVASWIWKLPVLVQLL